ncbi:MAG TPA: phosphate-starvation-inducible PsiE family protein [Stellaceae bacterium]
MLRRSRRHLSLNSAYDRFETIISAIIIFLVSLVIIHAIGIVGIMLFQDFRAGISTHESAAMKETFGLMLTVLILVEFNHSIVLAMRRHSGVLQVRVVVLIAIIVIARKLILLDYATTSLQTLLGLGGLALSLGALYWLLNDVDRRRSRRADEADELAAAGEEGVSHR